jgi:hypothetical protein
MTKRPLRCCKIKSQLVDRVLARIEELQPTVAAASPAYPIVAGKLAPSWLSGSTKLALKNQIEAAIVRVLSADAKGGVVSSGSLQANYPSFTSETGEANHFTSASQVTLGARYYGLWRQLNGL